MELEAALKGVAILRERIHKEKIWDNPTELSDVAIKLSVYYSYIGDYVADLHKDATDTNYQIFLTERKTGSAVNAAEKKAHGESTEQRRAYENILVVRKSIEQMISIIQTRLRILETQSKNYQ